MEQEEKIKAIDGYFDADVDFVSRHTLGLSLRNTMSVKLAEDFRGILEGDHGTEIPV